MRFLFLLLFPVLAFGQTRTVTLATGVDSIWSVQTWISTKTVISLSMMDASGGVIATAPTVSLNVLTNLTANFPAVPAAVTVTKLQANATQAGNGWLGVWTATYTLPTPLSLQAGDVVSISYDPTNITLSSATLTATVVSVAPPPPPPPVITAQSPAGSTCPTTCPLVDANGASWNLSGSNATKNGVITEPSGYTAIYKLQIGSTGIVRLFDRNFGYICQVNGSWGGSC